MADPPDKYPLLARIESPQDLKRLRVAELPQLAAELREFLIQNVATRGGHFAAGLGTVELTVALHYVYDTPERPHRVGRGPPGLPAQGAHRAGGTSCTPSSRRMGSRPSPPAPRANTTPSASATRAPRSAPRSAWPWRAAQLGEKRRAVAVIGDGALTAGMAFEALNHAGSLPNDLLVILNDNDMSISENVGALSNYFARVLSGRVYAHLREGGKKMLRPMPTVWELARRSEEHMKGMVLAGTLFEEMGFNYIGPMDGHDVKALVSTLRNLRKLKGPQFLHVVTRKGKGYAPAEADPIKWHGPGPFDPASGTIFKEKSTGPDVFADLRPVAVRHGRARSAHHRHHARDARRLGARGVLEALSRALFRRRHRRTARGHVRRRPGGGRAEAGRRDLFDVPAAGVRSADSRRGAAEPAGGVRHRSRRASSASDGATHQGSYDLSYLRCIPNMTLMAPADENECRQMLYTASLLPGPSARSLSARHGPGRRRSSAR